MKYATFIIVLMLSGCASKPTQDELVKNITEHVERAQINKVAFCEGSKLRSYLETDAYYNWTCDDGSNFMVKK